MTFYLFWNTDRGCFRQYSLTQLQGLHYKPHNLQSLNKKHPTPLKESTVSLNEAVLLGVHNK